MLSLHCVMNFKSSLRDKGRGHFAYQEKRIHKLIVYHQNYT